jgi:hypothetical protein
MIDHMDWHDLELVEPEGRAQAEWVHYHSSISIVRSSSCRPIIFVY